MMRFINSCSATQAGDKLPLPVGVQSTQHMRVYYCFLAKSTKQVQNKEDTDELMQILLKSRITTETEIPEEDHVLSIDGVKFFARGDLHALKAKQKQGKTTALKVILGALTNGELFKLKSQMSRPRRWRRPRPWPWPRRGCRRSSTRPGR